MRKSLLLVGLALGSFVCLSGCEPKKSSNSGKAGSQAVHDHAADAHAGHDHGAHGPNGGHLEHFDTTGDHFEWAHDDATHKLSIFFDELVSAGAKIESVKIDVVSGAETKSFALEKDETAKIAGSVFSIASEELMTLLDASGTDAKGVQSKLLVMIDGKEQTCLLKHDDGHKH